MNSLAQNISDYQPCITFAPGQNVTIPSFRGLLADYSKRNQFFYGIEITALAGGKPTCLDFNEFLPVLPAFISLVWIGVNYWNVSMEQVHTLQLARYLEKHIPVLPHFTAYRLSEQRLDEFLALNFSNVLAVRGNSVHEGQKYIYGRQLVEQIRLRHGDSMSICVAGSTRGYRTGQDIVEDAKTNIEYLRQKVAAGADCIITGIAYSAAPFIQFTKDCRQAGITVPIIPGLIVPNSWESYLHVKELFNWSLPPDLLMELRSLRDDQNAIAKFFVQLTINTILEVREANLGIQGVHFFTMNRFDPVKEVVKELHALQILK